MDGVIDDATLQRLRQLLAPDFRSASNVTPRVLATAAFPGNQADGTQVTYRATAVSTGAQQDVFWTFVYSAADAYWYAANCQPLVGYATGAFSSSIASTYQDTLTPKITIPFAGDYTIRCGALAAMATSQATAILGPGKTAVIPPVGFAEASIVANTATSLIWDAEFSQANAFACAAGDQISCIAWTDNGTPSRATFSNRHLSIQPLRVR